MESFECYLLEYTGSYTPFEGGISSPIYKRADTGALEHVGWCEHAGIERAKPGAIFFNIHGTGLAVRTPGGDWFVDQNSSKSNRPWSRTGVPPKITVTPSISFTFDELDGDGKPYPPPEYHRPFHGVLENGILREV